MAVTSRRPRRRKKGKSNNYFTHDTELAILKFQVEPELDERQRIFKAEIRPAFEKLIENIIYVYKFHTLGNIEILKNDCMSFLFETIPKFDGTRGCKAFSYYNVITRNWFSQQKKNHTKRSKTNVQFDSTILSTLEKDANSSVVVSYEEGMFRKEFLLILKDELKAWRNKFDKPQERIVLEAIIVLFESPDILPLYNKKGIYMYLREITGMNTKQVVTNLTKFRRKYAHLKERYLAGEM